MIRRAVVVAVVLAAGRAQADVCTECHKKITPGIVDDWALSAHAKKDVACTACHGEGHRSRDDVLKAQLPTLETCARCHTAQAREFKASKHAAAWVAMKAMPTAHHQPQALMDGMKGCGGCHKIGLKTDAEIRELRAQGQLFGNASCDSCHTRHLFSVVEARSPEACRTCHMGFDHPQWEMYSGSKHGVRHALKSAKLIPAHAAAPTCQSCHMQEGDHGVKTAWGFLAVRLPLPEDQAWAADRTVILQALGLLDPAGNPTKRLAAVKAADMARLDEREWQALRDRELTACTQCHAINFARREMEQGEELIRQADRLMAEGIRVVAGLYRDGTLAQPPGYAHPFPDLLTFHDAPTRIEQRLFVMFFEHRMRTFQGAFHNNPDYALWYGWSEMQRDLREIQELAQELRLRKGAGRAAEKSAKKKR